MSCDYPDCSWQGAKDQSHDQSKCVFHAKVGEKGISVAEFDNRIFNMIKTIDYCFRGFLFPRGMFHQANITFTDTVDFSDAEFDSEDGICVLFDNLVFQKDITFEGARFKRGEARFTNSTIQGRATFERAIFENAKAKFKDTIFQEYACFDSAKFLAGVVFESCQFQGKGTTGASFYEALFGGAETTFRFVRFEGAHANFMRVAFLAINSNFDVCSFSHDAYFCGIEITHRFLCADIKFSNLSSFHFTDIEFSSHIEHPPCIIFNRVNFNPFNTYFENIRAPKDTDKIKNPIPAALIFRHCNLKDVYFSNNDMSLFSFYKSPYFEQSHFTTVEWAHRFEFLIS